jgi:hypothetical protein
MPSSSNTRSKVIESINNARSIQHFKRLLSGRVTKNITKEEAFAELKDVVSERAANTITGGLAGQKNRMRSTDTMTHSSSSMKDELFKDFPSVDRSEFQLETAVKAGRRLLNVLAETPFMWAVRDIVEQCPHSVRTVNAVGRTPLHVASVNCASSDVIMYLIQVFPRACQVIDSHGMTPLHCVAHASYWTKTGEGILWGSGAGDFEGPTYSDLIKAMVQAHPGALSIEDGDGCNPIEYAILHDAPLAVVSHLQRASVKLNKTQDRLETSMTVERTYMAQQPLPPTQRDSMFGRAA